MCDELFCAHFHTMRDDPLGRCHTMGEYDVTPIENIRSSYTAEWSSIIVSDREHLEAIVNIRLAS